MGLTVRIGLVAVLACAAACARAGCAATAAGPAMPPGDASAGAPLETAPGVQVVVLPSGLRCTLVEHPGEEISVRLLVRAGSMREAPGRAGLAHFVQRLALEGSARFPPGEARRAFTPEHTAYGSADLATIGYDHAEFALGATGEDGLDLALGFCADVLTGLAFEPERIEAQRGAILELLRMTDGPRRRAQERLLEGVAGGSSLEGRWPWGEAGVIAAATRDDLLAFWRAWYTPANAELIVVGPGAASALPRIRAALGGLEPRPAPAWSPDPVEAAPPREARAIVIEEPGLRSVTVSLLALSPPDGPARTEADLRRRLLDQLSAELVSARLTERASVGDVPASGVEAGVKDVVGVARAVHVEADGAGGDAAELAAQVRRELERFNAHGVAGAELDSAWARVLASIESQAAPDPGAAALADWFAQRAGAGDHPYTPATALALARSMAAGLTPEQAGRHAAGLFGLREAYITVQGPPGPWMPTPARVLRADDLALAQRPAPLLGAPREVGFDALVPPPPPGGVVERLTRHPGLGVTTARLSGGVAVHHRQMGGLPGRVLLRVALAGGVAEETVQNRGITEAAAAALAHPGLGESGSGEVARALASRDLSLRAEAAPEALHLVIEAPAHRLGAAMGLARELLCGARAEPVVVSRWAARKAIELQAEAHDPAGAARDALLAAWYPADLAPAHPPTTASLWACDAPAVQAWLDRLARTAPAIVSIVGDVAWDEALEAAAEHLGPLPPRLLAAAPPSPGEAQAAPGGWVECAAAMPGEALAGVCIGIAGPDPADMPGVRAVLAGAAILSARLADPAARAEAAWARASYTIDAQHPGFSRLEVTAACDPARAADVAEALTRALDDFVLHGPTPAEAREHRERTAGYVEQTLASPAIWSHRLCSLPASGRPLDELLTMRADYAALTHERIARALREARDRGCAFRVIAAPER